MGDKCNRDSYLDTDIGKAESKLIESQEHIDSVWSVMNPIVHRYIDGYLEGISHAKDLSTPENNFTIFLQELISKNDTLHDKYHELFDMEEYGEDVEGFKNSIKKRNVMLFTKLCRADQKL